MINKQVLKAIRPRIEAFKESIYLLKKNKLTKFAYYGVIVSIVIALIVPILLPARQNIDQDTNPKEELLAPSIMHPFGTD